MAEHTIILTDGSTALLNTTLSIGGMRKMKEKKLISSKMLTTMAAGLNPKDIDSSLDLAADAAYIAYVNANQDDHLTKEEFFDVMPYDMIEIMQIFTEIIGGEKLGSKFNENFEKVTSKKPEAEPEG